MKNIIVYVLSFVTAFAFTVAGMAMWRSATGQNDHIYLFHNGSASYIADHACVIDAPLTRTKESMQLAFTECMRLHKIHQEEKSNESSGSN